MSLKFRFKPNRWGTLTAALALPGLLVWFSASGGATADKAEGKAPSRVELEKQFSTTIRPFMQNFCVSCHGKASAAAQLDLTSYKTLDSVIQGLPHWTLLMEKLAAKQMPPSDFSKQPTEKQRTEVMAWIRNVRLYEAMRNAGDPGPVPARRLSNSEYDYTIRDLTGVDLRPTREFPVDPANQEGFDNTGESLTLSPALIKKYAQAAKDISDKLVLTATGFEFATHPVLAETDRDKFCVLRIVDFYNKQPTELAPYFEAAWRYRHRAALGKTGATLKTIATEAQISPKYLELLWATLNNSTDQVGPMVRLRSLWNTLPTPNGTNNDTVHTQCLSMQDWVRSLRTKVAWKFNNLRVPRGFSTGGFCFVLYKDRQYATHRQKFSLEGAQIGGVPKVRTVRGKRQPDGKVPETKVPDPIDPDLFVPENESERAPYIASFDRFCSVFPDAFYISGRGRMFIDDPHDGKRLLSAGFHNSMGYFRDDAPLMELILDDEGRKKLDNLWQDFDTVASVPERMYLENFTNERAESGTITDPEFNFAKAEDKGTLADDKIRLFADLYLAKAERNGVQPETAEAIVEHFRISRATIRATEWARLETEPVHVKALLDFAARAYRRPLSDTERNGLLAFYKSLRDKDGLTHEDAIRDCVVYVLMSPNFLFRLDLDAPTAPKKAAVGTQVATTRPIVPKPTPTPPPTGGVEPLSDYALASRLSYFLWSSMPDKELLAHAAARDLHKPEVLAAQARRMVRDPRVRALALEFAGNWLDYRRFEEHNAVDRDRFPTFTNDLRQAMFEEPVRFLVDEFQNNRSVLDVVYGKYTFVNAPLAKHYGMTDVAVAKNQWVRVENADRYGRGGFLPMAVFLTKNSPGLRTSPVKRGYWVVRRLLGEYIPPPPAKVPDLPADEGKLGDMTLRQALERHRQDPACASCHARFDSYGLVFENYGPIGELRTKDLGGKSIDTKAPFPNSPDRIGVAGLREYVRQQREQDFLDTYCRKLLSYSLGRSLQPSDDLTITEMRKRLIANGYRFGTLVDTIIQSKQFRYRRVGERG